MDKNKKKRDVQAGLLALRKRMPALENIFDAFGRWYCSGKADDLLADWNGYEIPEAYAPRFEQGVALLSDMELPDLGEKYREVFMLVAGAVAEGLPAISKEVDEIVVAVGEVENFNDLAKALWDEDGKLLRALIDEWKIDDQTLAFIGTMALKPFMARMEPEAAKAIETWLGIRDIVRFVALFLIWRCLRSPVMTMPILSHMAVSVGYIVPVAGTSGVSSAIPARGAKMRISRSSVTCRQMNVKMSVSMSVNPASIIS